MDSRNSDDLGGVIGHYVGTVTSYHPAVKTATVRLRAPVRTGDAIRIASEGVEWDQPVRLIRRIALAPVAEEEVSIKVHQPVVAGADIYRLWRKTFDTSTGNIQKEPRAA